jgi:protein-disulfide isomerase
MPPEQQATALVKSAGLDQFFRQRGVPQAKIDACLADQQGLQKLADLTALGQKEGITGTPAFLINGEQVNITDPAIWPQLEPAIRTAIGG